MKLFVSYIWLHRRSMAVLVLFCAVFAGTFALYRLPLAAVAYPAALCAGLGLCLVGLDYLRFRRRREAVARLAGQGAALAGGLPVPGDAIEEGYQALVRSLQAEVSALAEREGEKYREMTDYYTLWAHQIKTPIAAMRLTLQKEDTEVSRSLSRDLLRIEQYVEMVLAFLRLDSTSTDYVFQACPLDAIIRKAARRFSEEFIARRLKLRYQPIDAVVVTDAKWLGFVLEQVLSNGLKYTRTGGITISMRGGRTGRPAGWGCICANGFAKTSARKFGPSPDREPGRRLWLISKRRFDAGYDKIVRSGTGNVSQFDGGHFPSLL